MSIPITLSRIESLIASIGVKQISVEPTVDPDLNFKMWGGKDAAGLVTKWLAKDKAARVASLNILGFTTGYVKSDASGNLSVGTFDISIYDHNDLSNIQGGTAGQYYHMTSAQNAELHSPLTVAGAPLTLSGQQLTFNYDTGDFTLSGNNLKIQNKFVTNDGTRPFVATQGGITPVAGSDLATKDYVDNVAAGITTWLSPVIDFYDPTSGLPGSPNPGDRYISSATANGWTGNYIYEYNGSTWDETIPSDGTAVWNQTTDTQYMFTGSSWIAMSSVSVHNNLSGLQGGTASQYYHLTSAEHTYLQYLHTGLTQSNILFGKSDGSVDQSIQLNWLTTDSRLRLVIMSDYSVGNLIVNQDSADTVAVIRGDEAYLHLISAGSAKSAYLQFHDNSFGNVRTTIWTMPDSTITEILGGELQYKNNDGSTSKFQIRTIYDDNTYGSILELNMVRETGGNLIAGDMIGQYKISGQMNGLYNTPASEFRTTLLNATSEHCKLFIGVRAGSGDGLGIHDMIQCWQDATTGYDSVRIHDAFLGVQVDPEYEIHTSGDNGITAAFGHGSLGIGVTTIFIGDDTAAVDGGLKLKFDSLNNIGYLGFNSSSDGTCMVIRRSGTDTWIGIGRSVIDEDTSLSLKRAFYIKASSDFAGTASGNINITGFAGSEEVMEYYTVGAVSKNCIVQWAGSDVSSTNLWWEHGVRKNDGQFRIVAMTAGPTSRIENDEGLSITTAGAFGFNKLAPSEKYEFGQGNIKYYGHMISTVVTATPTGSSYTWNVDNGDILNLDLSSASATFTLDISNMTTGGVYMIRIYNDGSVTTFNWSITGYTVFFAGGDDTITANGRSIAAIASITSTGLYISIGKDYATA